MRRLEVVFTLETNVFQTDLYNMNEVNKPLYTQSECFAH